MGNWEYTIFHSRSNYEEIKRKDEEIQRMLNWGSSRMSEILAWWESNLEGFGTEQWGHDKLIASSNVVAELILHGDNDDLLWINFFSFQISSGQSPHSKWRWD